MPIATREIESKTKTMLTRFHSAEGTGPSRQPVCPSATSRGKKMRAPIAGLGITLAAVTAMVGCGVHVAHNLPPASRLMHPGPGVGGPGPGVIQPASHLTPMAGGGAGSIDGGPGCIGGYGPTSQIAFRGVNGMEVAWDVSGDGLFDAVPLVTPGSQNFPQGAIYRLKLTNIPGRPGV